MGGDEFCACREDVDADVFVAALPRACGHGDGFAVTAAYGASRCRRGRDASEALSWPTSGCTRTSTGADLGGEQSSGVLMRALAELTPTSATTCSASHKLAERWRRARTPRGRGQRVRLAAALHDVGKMAIPEAILEKPGPLTEHERVFVNRHTLIGARILHAAPDLSHLADIVRSSHERIDGKGYPDGLPGSEIPLASRIIFVCDAFDAMTSERSYARAMTPEAAFAELQRCAGTQFDSGAVAALGRALEQTTGTEPLVPLPPIVLRLVNEASARPKLTARRRSEMPQARPLTNNSSASTSSAQPRKCGSGSSSVEP